MAMTISSLDTNWETWKETRQWIRGIYKVMERKTYE